MDGYTLTTSLTKALVWPLVVLIVLWVLRREVKGLVAHLSGRLAHLKAGGFEASFREALDKLSDPASHSPSVLHRRQMALGEEPADAPAAAPAEISRPTTEPGSSPVSDKPPGTEAPPHPAPRPDTPSNPNQETIDLLRENGYLMDPRQVIGLSWHIVEETLRRLVTAKSGHPSPRISEIPPQLLISSAASSRAISMQEYYSVVELRKLYLNSRADGDTNAVLLGDALRYRDIALSLVHGIQGRIDLRKSPATPSGPPA